MLGAEGTAACSLLVIIHMKLAVPLYACLRKVYILNFLSAYRKKEKPDFERKPTQTDTNVEGKSHPAPEPASPPLQRPGLPSFCSCAFSSWRRGEQQPRPREKVPRRLEPPQERPVQPWEAQEEGLQQPRQRSRRRRQRSPQSRWQQRRWPRQRQRQPLPSVLPSPGRLAFSPWFSTVFDPPSRILQQGWGG